jgi:HEAT repeat protein
LQHLSTDELGQLLFSSAQPIREEALRWLTQRHEERAIRHLSSALENTSPGEFFYELVEALVTFGDAQALPALTSSYLRIQQDLPRLALLRAIGALKGQESETFLLSVLHPRSPWILQIPALGILLSRQQTNLLPQLLDAFVASPLPDKLAALLQKAACQHPEWEVAAALTLRLMFIDSISEEHVRAAIKVFSQVGSASAIPLIQSWISAAPALRRIGSIAIHRLKKR